MTAVEKGAPVRTEKEVALAARGILKRFGGTHRLQSIAIALFFLSISLVFFNKIFTSDYGIHLSIGRHVIETGEIPHREFLVYPILGQPMNFEEIGFQVILYLVYRAVGSIGVSVFVWLMGTTAFFFLYKSLRARDINPWVVLFTLLVFAMPFRIRLQPRPEIFAYFFCTYLMYGCALFYYRGNRKIIYSFPLVFLVWSNIHPSTLAGFATIGAFGTQSLVVIYREKFSRESLKTYLLIPLAVLAASFLATFLSQHGIESILTPLRLIQNPQQMTGISEMVSIKRSGFYEHYKYLFALAVFSLLLGIVCLRVSIHDVVYAVYGLRLPLQVARGMAFMSIFTIPLVAVSFDAFIRRVGEFLVRREAASARAKAAREKESLPKSKKKKGRKADGERVVPASAVPETVQNSARRLRIPVAAAWLFFFVATGAGALYIRVGTVDLVENGIGLTENKFSLPSGEFLRNLDIRGNMFNFFDLGGFIAWQVAPGKKIFIDGRAGIPELFMEHQYVTSLIGDVEAIFRKHDITYVVTKAVDSGGLVLPLINYLATSPNWEIVFADGLAMVFVRNVPENRDIIERYRVPKGVVKHQIIQELVHLTFLGVDKIYAYTTIGNIYLRSGDIANAKRFFELARAEKPDPKLDAFIRKLGGMGKPP
jgi:hypothetical protein